MRCASRDAPFADSKTFMQTFFKNFNDQQVHTRTILPLDKNFNEQIISGFFLPFFNNLIVDIQFFCKLQQVFPATVKY